MAAIEGSYTSIGGGDRLVVSNADDSTGKCKVAFWRGDEVWEVVGAHYHFEDGSSSRQAKTMLGILAVGDSQNQELVFRSIIFNALDKRFTAFFSMEARSQFGPSAYDADMYVRDE